MPEAVASLRTLVDTLGAANVYVVSKAGSRIIAKTKQWLEHHRVYERTGLLVEHVHFCARRKDKVHICERYPEKWRLDRYDTSLNWHEMRGLM